MDCHILVEKQPTNGYVATVMGWPDCIGTGATKDEALTKVQAVMVNRLKQVEIVHFQVEEPNAALETDPWEQMIGRFVQDSQWEDFQSELRNIRAEANRD